MPRAKRVTSLPASDGASQHGEAAAVIEKEMVEPLSEDIVGSAEDYRRATRIASAYPFPTIEEVALTATRCAISNAAHQTADLVVLAGPVAERKVLLIRRAYPPFAGTYAIPGGHLDAGESPHQAAVRELQEETGIDVEGVDFVGLYTGASRDPRLSDSFVFVHQVGETIPEPRAGSDAAGVEWVSLENIAEGRVSLGFDHAQILRDTLASLDNGSPYLGRLEDIIAASDNRNADLLTEVDRMRGRGAIGAADIHLHEYDALKKESTAHIQSRNVFVWLNVVVLTAILCFFFLHENYTALLLAVPGLTLIFGWFYLVHNDKIAALSAYIGYGLAKRVGQEYFAFERSDKRGTQCSKTYNIAQVVVELLLFVVPAIVAPLGYLLWPQPPEVTLVSFSPVGIILVVVEILLALTLAVMLVLSSNLVRRWDVPRETWERL